MKAGDKIPLNVPRYIVPSRADCDCRRKQLDMEFKFFTLEWLVRLGDTVEKGEVVAEGEVEKVFFEVRSPAKGILSEICFTDGENADIHKPIATITVSP